MMLHFNQTQLLKMVNDAQSLAVISPPRSYLGMSSMGKPCARRIWYTWRWASPEQFTPRMYRLFNRGHREESLFVDMLRLAGFKVSEVDPETREQYEFISGRGHVKGHCDGIGEIEDELMVLEFKTHNQNSFNQLRKTQSVRVSKNEHYCQMQRYMHELNLDLGLYGAVCKNDDSLYFEVVKRDPETIDWLLERQEILMTATCPPVRISDNENYYICSYCWYRDICHGGKKLEKNCRTCKNSHPDDEGKWLCRRLSKHLLYPEQRLGCKKYQSISNL